MCFILILVFLDGQDNSKEVNFNLTYLTNKDYPKSVSSEGRSFYKINILPNICSVRLDFDDFTLAGADTDATVEADNGECLIDKFVINKECTRGTQMPVLCGQNKGNHGKKAI